METVAFVPDNWTPSVNRENQWTVDREDGSQAWITRRPDYWFEEHGIRWTMITFGPHAFNGSDPVPFATMGELITHLENLGY